MTQKFSTDNIRREFNNTEGIELLKVIVSNCGRFPAKITNVSFGYGVQGKEYRYYFSRYTIGLFPHVLSPDKTVPSLPQKIDDGDEFSVYYNYWDAFRDLQEDANNKKSDLALHAYVKLVGKKKEKKSKSVLKLRRKQSTTLGYSFDKNPSKDCSGKVFLWYPV